MLSINQLAWLANVPVSTVSGSAESGQATTPCGRDWVFRKQQKIAGHSGKFIANRESKENRGSESLAERRREWNAVEPCPWPIPAGGGTGCTFLFQLFGLHSFPTLVSEGLLGA